MAMKIENYTGSADTFTWPNNPISYDDALGSNYTITNIDYQRYHIFVSGGGVPPKQIVMTGHLFGSSKNTNYQSLSKHFTQTTQLKKLYFDSDKFHLGFGKQIKKTHTGGRTNFIDYVATFETIAGILFDNTQQTAASGDNKTNGGNVTTFIEEITGTVTSGASSIIISDNSGNEITIPAAALTTAQAIVIKFVEMVDSGDGIFVTEYNYTTIAGTQTNRLQVTDGLGMLQLAAAESTSTFSIANVSSYAIKFRDGWSA